jgi:hypothetical protein
LALCIPNRSVKDTSRNCSPCSCICWLSAVEGVLMPVRGVSESEGAGLGEQAGSDLLQLLLFGGAAMGIAGAVAEF